MNTSELNKVLSDEIRKLRAGKSKPEHINAITHAAAQILAGARLELTYMKLIGARTILPFFTRGRLIDAPKKRPARLSR